MKPEMPVIGVNDQPCVKNAILITSPTLVAAVASSRQLRRRRANRNIERRFIDEHPLTLTMAEAERRNYAPRGRRRPRS